MINKNLFFQIVILSFSLLLVLAVPVWALDATSAELKVGDLVKGSNSEVFIYQADGQLHWIPDEATFIANNFSWSTIVTLTDEELIKYSIGESLPLVVKPLTIPTLAETEKRVREYWADVPAMISVAECESKFRQFNNDGTVLKGSGLYVGIFQIDEKIHADWAKQLGMDIYTVEGNLAYARHLYEKSGTKPWAGCVKNHSTTIKTALTTNLKMGDESLEVKTLQQLLNQAGFMIAKLGVGSPGNETQYFGSLTREAVRRFQCAKGIVCNGTETTTGYGLVGPKTRAVLSTY